MAEKRRRRLVMSLWSRCRTFGASIQSADRTVAEVLMHTLNKVEMSSYLSFVLTLQGGEGAHI
jgi:hypothetical protein